MQLIHAEDRKLNLKHLFKFLYLPTTLLHFPPQCLGKVEGTPLDVWLIEDIPKSLPDPGLIIGNKRLHLSKC